MSKRTANKKHFASKQAQATEKGLLNSLESFFEKHHKKIALILLFCSVVISFFLFDAKISTGGDDSAYIERAFVFLNEGKFPFYQGPLYPLTLSLIIKVFGFNLILLKIFSILFYNIHVWIIYITFRKRIPYTLLIALVSFISFNSFLQYYSSQTYTEAFFLFIQSICIYWIVRIIDISNNTPVSWITDFKNNYKVLLMTGFSLLLLSLSKSIAIICIVPAILFFIIYKNFRFSVYVLFSFTVFRIIYQIITSVLYGGSDSGQFEQILRKDLYKPELGHEDFGGLIDRFLNNFNTYFSLHTYRMLYIRNIDTNLIIPPLAFFTFLIIAICAFIALRKNKYIFFLCIYTIIVCFGVFMGIQANNMQERLIIIVIPYLFIIFIYGTLLLAKRAKAMVVLFFLLMGSVLLFSFFHSSKNAMANIPALKKNLSGDIYYGYTPDWANYLKLSKWCADSLPANSYVMARKASMSFIASGGKKFCGVYVVFSQDPDSVLAFMAKNKVTHVIVASLRKDPKKNTGEIINTMQRLLYPIAQKYQKKLRLVKTMGTTETAELYEIQYND